MRSKSAIRRDSGPCARVLLYSARAPRSLFPHSCARACTVASEVFTEAQSFADCKLHIRTRLLASAFSNFWTTLILMKTFWSEGSSLGSVSGSIYLVLLPPSSRLNVLNRVQYVSSCEAMAFITISGYPCSGKSRRAEQLRAHLAARLQDPSYDGPQLKVVVVSDDSLNIARDVYNGEHVFESNFDNSLTQ